ncbi:hypothetical protein CSKR_111953 [Clonorchis sinensis]|uniref:Uncharacterized protein n=1 Tax=Clonorchis sinensis TaxID=79923 RepID=A0A419PVT3_CLOSI|nr:hypothetical protein CSKR_111953 [Clonorchis sinensis]
MTKASNLTNDRNNSFLLSKTSNNSCASEQKELGAKHVKGTKDFIVLTASKILSLFYPNGCNLFRSLPLIVRTRVADELLYSNLQMNPAFVATVTWVRRRTPLSDRLMPLSSCKHKCERNGLGLLPGLGFANTSLMRYVSKTTVVEDLKETQLRCPKRLRLTMIHQNGPFS